MVSLAFCSMALGSGDAVAMDDEGRPILRDMDKFHALEGHIDKNFGIPTGPIVDIEPAKGPKAVCFVECGLLKY